MYEFWYDYVKPKNGQTEKKNYIIRIQTFIAYTQKKNTFTQTMKKILKQELILQSINQKDHYLNEKVKI